jgi:hypothetical protein
MGSNQQPQNAEQPTAEWCGSPGKIAVLPVRAALELPLYVEGDSLFKVSVGLGTGKDGRARRNTRGQGSRRR